MEIIRTIVCKLDATPEEGLQIDATLEAFASACNRITEVCRELDSTSRYEDQKACYHAIRGEFGLSSNLTIRAIARVCTALKVPEKWHSVFTPGTIEYDSHLFTLFEDGWYFIQQFGGISKIRPSRRCEARCVCPYRRSRCTRLRPADSVPEATDHDKPTSSASDAASPATPT